jgi:hypothetical protein
MIEVKVKIEGGNFSRKKWGDKIASKQRAKSLPVLRALFKQTTYGWSDKPDFGWEQVRKGDEISITVFPSGQHADTWAILNAGSPAHTINARPGGVLAFRPGYKAATTPGSLKSGRKYRSGPLQFAKRVNHPGFPARNFVQLISEEFNKNYASDIQDAIFEAAAKT